MRFLLVFGLVAMVPACEHAPPPPAPTPSPTLIEKEPISPASAEGFQGCDYDPTPLLTITDKRMLLDGSPVDDAELGSVLENKQAIYAVLGVPEKKQIVLQVSKGVSERRVARVLRIASAAGFTDVERVAAVEPPERRSKTAHAGNR